MRQIGEQVDDERIPLDQPLVDKTGIGSQYDENSFTYPLLGRQNQVAQPFTCAQRLGFVPRRILLRCAAPTPLSDD